MESFDRPARPRRRGCAGCLLQCTVVLLGGCLLIYGLTAVLAPWNFYFGGHFHTIPGWTGRGWIHSGGHDYFLSITFTPTIPGYRKSPIKGTGFLCTPRGQKFRLHFGGEMPRRHGTDLRGVPLHLYFYNWPLFANFVGDRRPSFDLYGTFGTSQLVMEDRGSLARAFRPDATLYASQDRSRPQHPESVRVTLQEDASWISSSSCPAAPE